MRGAATDHPDATHHTANTHSAQARLMSIQPFQALACPLDGAPCGRRDVYAALPSGHQFRHCQPGYTYLPPVQQSAPRSWRQQGRWSPLADVFNAGFTSRLLRCQPGSTVTSGGCDKPADTIRAFSDAGW